MAKRALVTVGSTKFDALIKAIDDVRIVHALISLDYGELIIQTGNGSYALRNIMDTKESQSTLDSGFRISCFDYVPSLVDLVEKSSLIICHAGAGSVFEGLQANKTLIVVPNALLMDNHQVELADRLEAMGHLISATPETLLEKIKSLKGFTPVPYQSDNPARIAQRIDQLFPRRMKDG